MKPVFAQLVDCGTNYFISVRNVKIMSILLLFWILNSKVILWFSWTFDNWSSGWHLWLLDQTFQQLFSFWIVWLGHAWIAPSEVAHTSYTLRLLEISIITFLLLRVTHRIHIWMQQKQKHCKLPITSFLIVIITTHLCSICSEKFLRGTPDMTTQDHSQGVLVASHFERPWYSLK